MWGLCRGIIFPVITNIRARGSTFVCVCTGKRRADTSLSVVLMVPLTTQQLLHIGVVLAVGFIPQRHAQTHTFGLAHAHTEVSCHDKKSQSLSAPFLPHSLSLFFPYDGRIYMWFTHSHTPCCSLTDHLHLFPSLHLLCVRLHVSCQSSVTCSLIELSTSGPCHVEGTPT